MYRTPRDITYKFPFLNGEEFLMGIYILWMEKECQYVGKSNDVEYRVARHYGLSGSGGGYNNGAVRLAIGLQGNFNKVQFINEENPLLQTILENFYIWKHKPKYNKRLFVVPPHITDDKEAFTFISRSVRSTKTWKGREARRSI